MKEKLPSVTLLILLLLSRIWTAIIIKREVVLISDWSQTSIGIP